MTGSNPAAAQSDVISMRESMTTYYRGERVGGIGFLTAGAASLVAGGLMRRSSSDLYHGMSYPMLGLGGLQVLIGGFVAWRAGSHIDEFKHRIASEPQACKDEELPRMNDVKHTFGILFFAELAIAAAGLTTAMVAYRAETKALTGIGAGLTIQALLILAQDAIASRRAKRYMRALEGFQVAVSPTGQQYWLAYRSPF
ncbi:MAG: hypothetical protein MJE77_13800 [Proteobacteria bacterium]|nr:hypothetical protein [Pseudomonadota bacterium]